MGTPETTRGSLILILAQLEHLEQEYRTLTEMIKDLMDMKESDQE